MVAKWRVTRLLIMLTTCCVDVIAKVMCIDVYEHSFFVHCIHEVFLRTFQLAVLFGYSFFLHSFFLFSLRNLIIVRILKSVGKNGRSLIEK